MIFFERVVLFFLISSKKFQAKTISVLLLSLIFFLLFSPISIHALPFDEQYFFDDSESKIISDSKIIEVNSDFFHENNFKRYLIFGSTALPNSILKNKFILIYESGKLIPINN